MNKVIWSAVIIVLIMGVISCMSLMTTDSQTATDEVIITLGDLQVITPLDQQHDMNGQKYHPTADESTDAGVMIKQTWTSIDGKEYGPMTIGKSIPYPVK